MSSNEGAGQLLVLRARPGVPPRGGTNDGRSVGHSTADDDICPRLEGLDDAISSDAAQHKSVQSNRMPD